MGAVSTHSHEDRTVGIKWLNDHAISTYASTLTNDILRAKKKVPAKHSFKEREIILGNGLIQVFYSGAGHSLDNLVVWLPKSKILCAGCFVRSLASSSLGNISEAHIEQWPNSAENAISKYREANLVILGHGEIGGLTLLKHTKYLAETASSKPNQQTTYSPVN